MKKLKSKKEVCIRNILLGILGIVLIYIIFINIYNLMFIPYYVKKTFPNYTIENKSFEYLDYWWSTFYDTKFDSFFLEIRCNTILKNKETGMFITIPLYHYPFQIYREEKNIKNKVQQYEDYWNSINNIKKKYNMDIQVSNVNILDSSYCDIFWITIYIKYQTHEKFIEQRINQINSINTSLDMHNISYVVSKEDIYESLRPWFNSYYTADNMERIDNNSTEYDVYYVSYRKEDDKKRIIQNKYKRKI